MALKYVTDARPSRRALPGGVGGRGGVGAEACGAIPGGAASSADLGGSSKYSRADPGRLKRRKVPGYTAMGPG